MLATSDFPIDEALTFFTRHGLRAGLLVPTETGLRKSIMDAHGTLRGYLQSQGIHDFSAQAKGPSNKVQIEAVVLGSRRSTKTRISLYRPETKDGDPRIWIYGLAEWARAGNLLAMFLVGERLYVANLSDHALWEAREDPDSPLGDLLSSFVSTEDLISEELVEKIRELARGGWIRSGRAGDTGVGYTLESALGIAANSSRSPDYKGIELKSGRGTAGRTSLFSQVPEWRASALTNVRDVLDNYGYIGDSGRLQLYCTNHARPNPQGLFMTVRDLDVHCMAMRAGSEHRVIQWKLASLEASLGRKHNSTFWVKADVCRNSAGVEFFHYRSIVHTRAALTANLGPLIDTGKVTMDLTLSELETGRVRDHGYLFRLEPRNQSMLFPPPTNYDLGPKLTPVSD